MRSENTRLLAILNLAGILALAPGIAAAASASASLDLASAYVFRGATFNDGLVLQPGLETDMGLPEKAGSLSLGVWGNLDLDDYDGALNDGEFSEIDLYGSYSLPVEAVDLGIGYTEYTYTSAGVEADREISLSAGLPVLLAPSLAAYYGVDGGIDKTLYLEAGLSHEQAITEALAATLEAAVGYVDPDEGEAGFSHYSATAGLGYKALSASVTYVGQIDDDVLADVEDEGLYDVDVYGVLGLAYEW